MNFIKIIFFCITLSSSLALALDGLPYGADSVHVDGGKVNVKGMNGQSVNVNNGNVDVQGMSGESVRTGGGEVNVKGMDEQSVRTKGNPGKKRDRVENEGEDEDVKEMPPAEEKE